MVAVDGAVAEAGDVGMGCVEGGLLLTLRLQMGGGLAKGLMCCYCGGIYCSC